MRYIAYIFLIILLVTIVMITYVNQDEGIIRGNAFLRVNERVITKDEFNRLFNEQKRSHVDRDEFINSLITKELLIQEAKRLGIDQEEAFRREIQDFYEQSLIKTLLDRKFSDFNIEVTDDEVENYLKAMNKTLYISVFSFKTKEEAEKGQLKNGQTRVVAFRDLSQNLRYKLLNPEPGLITPPIKAGGNYIVIRVDRVVEERLHVTASEEYMKKIRRQLLEEKKRQAVEAWITSLRKGARIDVYDEQSEEVKK